MTCHYYYQIRNINAIDPFLYELVTLYNGVVQTAELVIILIGKSLKETFTKWVYDAVFCISIWHFNCSMPFMSLTIHILCWYDQYNCHSVKWRFFEQPSMFSIQQNYSYFIFFNDSHSCFHEIYIDDGWTIYDNHFF